MSLTTLKKLIPPSEGKKETATIEGWRKAESQLGLRLPRDYREFIFTYGGGLFADFYYVYSPFSTVEGYSLFSRLDHICEILREERQSDGRRRVPFRIYPEKGGLLPWGGDENGNYYYWLTDGAPTKWKVVQQSVRGTGFKRLHCGMTAFLAGVLQREIPALAGGYPPIKLRCPIETCAGWVTGTHDSDWYCEECSFEWEGSEINRYIRQIVKKFPYRAKCYQKLGKKWWPTSPKREPRNYDELVEGEYE